MSFTFIDLAIVCAVAMVVGVQTFAATIGIVAAACVVCLLVAGCCCAVNLLLHLLRKDGNVLP